MLPDPTDLQAENEAREKAARRERALREVERSELRRLLSGKDGRTFVMRIIERAGVFRSSFPIDRPEDTHLAAFNEGRRNEGLRLFTDIVDSAPELWTTMLRERAARLDAEKEIE